VSRYKLRGPDSKNSADFMIFACSCQAIESWFRRWDSNEMRSEPRQIFSLVRILVFAIPSIEMSEPAEIKKK
jgi:hypothetical protein